MTAVLDKMRCPNCRGALAEQSGGALSCGSCGADYPVYDGIPWLYRDVASSRAQWAAKLVHFQATLSSDIGQVQKTLKRPDLMPSTRKRLKSLLRGYNSRTSEVQELLSPFDLAAPDSDSTLP